MKIHVDSKIELERLVYLIQNFHQKGWLYLKNIPTSVDWLKLAEIITQSQAMLQENGDYIYPVKPKIVGANRSHSQSINLVQVHTDGTYKVLPPHYVVLYCVEPASSGEGLTQLLEIPGFLQRELTEQEQRQLMLTFYEFASNDAAERTHQPVLDFPNFTDVRFRFSFNNLVYGESSPDLLATPNPQDSVIEGIANRFLDYFQENHFAIGLEKHSLLIWDNWTIAHGRTAFTNPSRHLLRAWLS